MTVAADVAPETSMLQRSPECFGGFAVSLREVIRADARDSPKVKIFSLRLLPSRTRSLTLSHIVPLHQHINTHTSTWLFLPATPPLIGLSRLSPSLLFIFSALPFTPSVRSVFAFLFLFLFLFFSLFSPFVALADTAPYGLCCVSLVVPPVCVGSQVLSSRLVDTPHHSWRWRPLT